MNLKELESKLVAAARMTPPNDRVPCGFEKRVLARLRSSPALDLWSLWARALWRAAAPCVAIALLLAAWNLFTSTANPPASGNGAFDVAQEFENTLLAAADQESSAESSR